MRRGGQPHRIASVGRGGSDSTVSQSDYERGRGRTSTTEFQGTEKMASVRGPRGIMALTVESGLRRPQRPVRSERTNCAERGAG
jgi:hypothetical protein